METPLNLETCLARTAARGARSLLLAGTFALSLGAQEIGVRSPLEVAAPTQPLPPIEVPSTPLAPISLPVTSNAPTVNTSQLSTLEDAISAASIEGIQMPHFLDNLPALTARERRNVYLFIALTNRANPFSLQGVSSRDIEGIVRRMGDTSRPMRFSSPDGNGIDHVYDVTSIDFAKVNGKDDTRRLVFTFVDRSSTTEKPRTIEYWLPQKVLSFMYKEGITNIVRLAHMNPVETYIRFARHSVFGAQSNGNSFRIIDRYLSLHPELSDIGFFQILRDGSTRNYDALSHMLVSDYVNSYRFIDESNNWVPYRQGLLNLPAKYAASLDFLQDFFAIDNKKLLTGIASRVKEGKLAAAKIPQEFEKYLFGGFIDDFAATFEQLFQYYDLVKDNKNGWERLGTDPYFREFPDPSYDPDSRIERQVLSTLVSFNLDWADIKAKATAYRAKRINQRKDFKQFMLTYFDDHGVTRSNLIIGLFSPEIIKDHLRSRLENSTWIALKHLFLLSRGKTTSPEKNLRSFYDEYNKEVNIAARETEFREIISGEQARQTVEEYKRRFQEAGAARDEYATRIQQATQLKAEFRVKTGIHEEKLKDLQARAIESSNRHAVHQGKIDELNRLYDQYKQVEDKIKEQERERDKREHFGGSGKDRVQAPVIPSGTDETNETFWQSARGVLAFGAVGALVKGPVGFLAGCMISMLPGCSKSLEEIRGDLAIEISKKEKEKSDYYNQHLKPYEDERQRLDQEQRALATEITTLKSTIEAKDAKVKESMNEAIKLSRDYSVPFVDELGNIIRNITFHEKGLTKSPRWLKPGETWGDGYDVQLEVTYRGTADGKPVAFKTLSGVSVLETAMYSSPHISIKPRTLDGIFPGILHRLRTPITGAKGITFLEPTTEWGPYLHGLQDLMETFAQLEITGLDDRLTQLLTIAVGNTPLEKLAASPAKTLASKTRSYLPPTKPYYGNLTLSPAEKEEKERMFRG